jgi:predicted NBD/HSP70 family sugar kinase
LLREINDRRAMDFLFQHGSMTRAELVAATGLSKPTASQVLSRLEATGLVAQIGTTSSGRGPNAQVYAVDPTAGFVIALDVTPAEVEVTVADITGASLATTSAPVDMRTSPDPVAAVAKAVRQATRRAGIVVGDAQRIVVGSPGVHHAETDRVEHAEHMAAWSRPGMVGSLQRRFGVPVFAENDVNLAAVAERSHGAAAATSSFALLWVGTGLGLAIDVGGTLHRGYTGGAGEVGYMPVPGFGDPEPGESAASFQSLVRDEAVVALARKHGIRCTSAVEALTKAYGAGERGELLLDELADRLATGTAMIVSVLDPEMVVLAGPTSMAGGAQLRDRVEERLRVLTPLHPRLAVSEIKDNPVLAGALEVGLTAARQELLTSAISARPFARSS